MVRALSRGSSAPSFGLGPAGFCHHPNRDMGNNAEDRENETLLAAGTTLVKERAQRVRKLRFAKSLVHGWKWRAAEASSPRSQKSEGRR